MSKHCSTNIDSSGRRLEPHQLRCDLFAKLGHCAGEALSQIDAGPPAKSCHAAHIQLFLGGAIGFGGVPADGACIASCIGYSFR